MTSINSVKNVLREQPQTGTPQAQNKIIHPNFKAESDKFVRQLSPQDRQKAIAQYEKERKSQKRKQNVSLAVSIGAGLAIIASVVMSIIMWKKGGMDSLRSKVEQEALKLKPENLSKIVDRPTDSYSNEVQQFVEGLEKLLTRKDIEAKGEKRIAQIQLGGPGGTGKTDVAGVIAKKIEKLFPGSEYYIPDLSMLSSSSYKGQDVQMLTEYTQDLCKRAAELASESASSGKKKYLIVFLDEFDKIAMQDFSHNIHESNKTTGALKTLINSLMKQDNVILMSATNYPELIEGAVSSRMSEKVFVDYLNPKQIITAITEHYKTQKYIAPEMLDKENTRLKKVCDIIGKKEHEMEYRKFQQILKQTMLKSPEEGNVELNHLIKALTEVPGIYGDSGLKLTEAEINELKSLII